MGEITRVDEDALGVMKQAGEEFAGKQIGRWSQNDWGDMGPEMRLKQMSHWQAVRDRIADLVQQIKQELRGAK